MSCHDASCRLEQVSIPAMIPEPCYRQDASVVAKFNRQIETGLKSFS